MKTLLFAAIALSTLVSSLHAGPTTTYHVIKASVTLPGDYHNFTGGIFLGRKLTLTTKNIINLAQGLDPNTPVPKNVILGFAGVLSGFATHAPDNQSPMKLVVYELPGDGTLNGRILATVANGGNRISAENVIINKYKRVASGYLSFVRKPGLGGSDPGFLAPHGGNPMQSVMLLTGTTTRTPPIDPLDPDFVAKLKVKTTATAIGSVTFLRPQPASGDSSSPTLIVSKGKFSASGKIVGIFSE